MSALWIANCSKQNNNFAYRRSNTEALSYENIRIGSQVKLPGDLSVEQIAAIIKQHKGYGIKDASEVQSTREFTGLCYSIDKPVQFVSFDAALETNDKVIKERSNEQREKVVASIAQRSIELSQDAGDKIQRIEVSTETDKAAEGIPEISIGSEIVMQGVQPKRGTLSRKQ